MSDSIMQMPSEMHVQMHHHHHHHAVFTPGLKQKRDRLRSAARCWEMGGLSGVRRGVSRFITADQQGAAATCWRQLAKACSRRERLRSDVTGAC